MLPAISVILGIQILFSAIEQNMDTAPRRKMQFLNKMIDIQQFDAIFDII